MFSASSQLSRDGMYNENLLYVGVYNLHFIILTGCSWFIMRGFKKGCHQVPAVQSKCAEQMFHYLITVAAL